MIRRVVVMWIALGSALGWAQSLALPPALEKLGQRASNRVEVSLDGPLLQAAAAFMNGKDPEEAAAKKLLAKLRGIYVHRYEFDGEDAGSIPEADLEALRKQLPAPQWSRVVQAHDKRAGESVEVFVRKDKDHIGGLVVVAREANELTVVDLDGNIDPADIVSLGGHFGIPSMSGLGLGHSHKDDDE